MTDEPAALMTFDPTYGDASLPLTHPPWRLTPGTV